MASEFGSTHEITTGKGNVYQSIVYLTEYFKKFSKIIDSHLNEFITADIWENTHEERKLLCDDCKYKEKSTKEDSFDKQSEHHNQQHITFEYGRCCFSGSTSDDKQDCLSFCNKHKKATSTRESLLKTKKMNSFLSQKKEHEILALSSVLEQLVADLSSSKIVDFGSGKGYLGQNLTATYGYDVLGIEMSIGCASSADKRKDVMKNANRKNNYTGYTTINYAIEPNSIEQSSEFVSLIQKNISTNHEGQSYILTGLHACGDLTSSAIRMFVKESCFKGLCIVGCCYNLISESGFPMSRFVKDLDIKLGKSEKMLACQCPVKWSETKQMLNKSLLQRALVEKILEDKKILREDINSIKFRRLGKGKKEVSSEKYMESIRLQCKALDDTLSFEEEVTYFQTYEKVWPQMKEFHWLRMQLGPIVESIILLDRLCFLVEAGFENAAVVQLFDPVISPRCYAIVCTRPS